MNIIELVLDGLAEVFTDYVPSFVGAVVGAVKALFTETSNSTTTGTIVLGIAVLCAGIAIVSSMMRYGFRLLRIKRSA